MPKHWEDRIALKKVGLRKKKFYPITGQALTDHPTINFWRFHSISSSIAAPASKAISENMNSSWNLVR